jgi:hypothetical protein
VHTAPNITTNMKRNTKALLPMAKAGGRRM